MYYYNPDEREAKELVPGINARTFWAEKMLAAVVDLDPNVHLPRHSHPHEQLGIVIEGQIEFIVEDQKQILGPGEVYVIPGGIEHEARTFDQPVKVMDVFSPVRKEYQY
jgi:quercetin dioxygenase-like cupin family protein